MFLNRVESAGLLLPVTEKILNRAVAGLSEVKAMLPRGFRLAVNVTPALLAEREFTQMCLALTEQQPFNMDRQTEEKLSRLCDAGVAFALDDSGTGCSVLSYLKHFPVSYIKMDRSFTQDILSEKTSRLSWKVLSGWQESWVLIRWQKVWKHRRR